MSRLRSFTGLATVAVLVLCMASIALARGAPSKEKAFSDQAIVSVQVAPVLTSVPPMTTGFDVIQNLSTPAYLRPANANGLTDTSEMTGLSTTGDERGFRSASYSARSGPNLTLRSRE